MKQSKSELAEIIFNKGVQLGIYEQGSQFEGVIKHRIVEDLRTYDNLNARIAELDKRIAKAELKAKTEAYFAGDGSVLKSQVETLRDKAIELYEAGLEQNRQELLKGMCEAMKAASFPEAENLWTIRLEHTGFEVFGIDENGKEVFGKGFSFRFDRRWTEEHREERRCRELGVEYVYNPIYRLMSNCGTCGSFNMDGQDDQRMKYVLYGILLSSPSFYRVATDVMIAVTSAERRVSKYVDECDKVLDNPFEAEESLRYIGIAA